ncbi:MAG: hypothetical protein VB912_07605, partial [Pirellulaceae bacterium]
DAAIDSIVLPNGLLVEAPKDDILGTLRDDPSIATDGIDMGAYELASLPLVVDEPDPGPTPPIDDFIPGGGGADWLRDPGQDERIDRREKSRKEDPVKESMRDHLAPVDGPVEYGFLESRSSEKRAEEFLEKQRSKKDDLFYQLGLRELVQADSLGRLLAERLKA